VRSKWTKVFSEPDESKEKEAVGPEEKPSFSDCSNATEKVYTKIVPNCSRATLQALIRGKVDIESTIHSAGHSGYDGLVDLGYKKHHRVQHSRDEFANSKSHINGIENFRGIAKMRLAKLFAS